MFTSDIIRDLTNDELYFISEETTRIYNSEAPKNEIKSVFLLYLLNIEIGIFYMDKFSNLLSVIRSEVNWRFNKNYLN